MMRVKHSFRQRLFAAFLLVSLIPLLLCSGMLLQIFRLRMVNQATANAQEQADNLAQSLAALYTGLQTSARALGQSELLCAALTRPATENTLVYGELFAATEQVRNFARFDLYDLDGQWRYSTHEAPLRPSLPTNWGVLYAAVDCPSPLPLLAAEEGGGAQSPLLEGAMRITDSGGAAAGYVVVSLSQTDLRHLLEGKFDSRSEYLLLSQYFRPIYASQSALALTLAPQLRELLLAGQGLDTLSEDYFYTVTRHQPTGLYLLLQSPHPFTQATMRMLYTVSLGCALVCVLVSVLMSLQISRQMFRPVRQLHQAIGEVEQNNLDASVTPHQPDELGQLAEHFNGMLVALKRNQSQLLDNQRELNRAQIRMLQAQLNPHFLCNTLDTMKWIGKINQVPQIALIATNLADILRFCISPEEFIPLHREIALVERYAEIQAIRLSGPFALRVCLPPELEDCLVPKLMLQPLVENSILHGLAGADHGELCISATQPAPGILAVSVTDNGCGLPQELLGPYGAHPRTSAQGHLGLYNVDTILSKFYGPPFGLYLAPGPGGVGACVTARLPIRRGEFGPQETDTKEAWPC